jgi:hypothetical protein
MQAIAPGSSGALHAGHSLPLRGAKPVPGLEGGRGTGFTAATGIPDGRGTGTGIRESLRGGPGAAAGAAAATGWRTGTAPTVNGF